MRPPRDFYRLPEDHRRKLIEFTSAHPTLLASMQKRGYRRWFGYKGPPLWKRLITFLIEFPRLMIAPLLRREWPRASRRETNRRIKLCMSCSEYYDPVGGICTHPSCGCSMIGTSPIKSKASFKRAQCPIGRWAKGKEQSDTTSVEAVLERIEPAPTEQGEVKCGVVIGSYGMPGIVELSIATIRKTCGDVPILISDDDTPEGRGRARLLGLPAKWPGVDLIINDFNLGHAPGDVRAFRNGLMWAKARGLTHLAKLSQRFIFLQDRWLHRSAEDLAKSGLAVASQRCFHQNLFFPLRSEAVLMDVARCASSGPLMARLDPKDKRQPLNDGKIQAAAENWVIAGLNEGGLMPVHRWRMIPPDRFNRYHDVLWHNSDATDVRGHKDDRYIKHAEAMGVDLGPEWSGTGWHVIAAENPQLGYKML